MSATKPSKTKVSFACSATRTIVAAVLFALVGASALLSPTADTGATSVGGAPAVTATAYDRR
jgi:hypothetical protein